LVLSIPSRLLALLPLRGELLLKSELLGLGLRLRRVEVIQIFQRSVAENNCWR
jgi:hypothetical protein